MHLVTHPDADGFLGAAQAGLERRGAESSLILGAGLGLRSAPAPADSPPYLATVHDDAGLVAAALQAAPYPLVLASARDGGDFPAALARVAGSLLGSGRPVPAAVAPEPLADAFAEAWGRVSGRAARVGMRQRLHALEEVSPVPAPPGILRRADAAELDQVARWMAAFDEEALGESEPERAREAARRRIAGGEVYLWDDGESRAMAARARPTRHTAAVNAVYTPPGLRGRGYAGACVAALSRLLLGEGRRLCVLFTDLANPTSNAIYARIGYRPVCDFTLYRFGELP